MNPEDKPITMPLRDWLIKRIALQKNIPSSVIEAIVSHQFDAANAAIHIHKSLEISGFGRFVFSDAKANYQLKRNAEATAVLSKKLESFDLESKDAMAISEKIDSIARGTEELTKRINL